MFYEPQQFETLLEEIERQSGALLPEPCMPIRLNVLGPQKPKVKPRTCGCYNKSRFVSKYEPIDKEMLERGGGFVTSCAVCDNMGEWPRYKDAL